MHAGWWLLKHFPSKTNLGLLALNSGQGPGPVNCQELSAVINVMT